MKHLTLITLMLLVSCGKQTKSITLEGKDGVNGTNGKDGADGKDGKDGENARKVGLSCNLHDLKSWDSKTSLPEALKNNPVIGSFVLPNLSVPDSQAINGFPGMPKELQDMVGIDGYALDCNGYLNIPTSGAYTIKLLSDDGSRLDIEDNYFVIDNQGLHAPKTVAKTGNLFRGENKINVIYYQGPVTQVALELRMSGPNMPEMVIPSTMFSH